MAGILAQRASDARTGMRHSQRARPQRLFSVELNECAGFSSINLLPQLQRMRSNGQAFKSQRTRSLNQRITLRSSCPSWLKIYQPCGRIRRSVSQNKKHRISDRPPRFQSGRRRFEENLMAEMIPVIATKSNSKNDANVKCLDATLFLSSPFHP